MKTKALIALFFASFFLQAQEQDFQIWSKAELSKKVTDNWSISLSQGLRLRENVTLTKNHFSNLNVGYKWNKRWKTAFGYRNISAFDLNQNVDFRHRLYSDIFFNKKKKRVVFKSRLRYQYQNEENILRYKLTMTYNVRKTKIEPFVNGEIFYDFSLIDKWRFSAGATFPLIEELDFNLYYRLQEPLIRNVPLQIHILGLKLSYKL